MLNLSLYENMSIKSNLRQRNNLCYFPLKCSWHRETELLEKSKHLLKHTSLVSDSRFQLEVKSYVSLLLLSRTGRTVLPLSSLPSSAASQRQNTSPGHAAITLCQPEELVRSDLCREKAVSQPSSKTHLLAFISSFKTPSSGADQRPWTPAKKRGNKCQGQL